MSRLASVLLILAGLVLAGLVSPPTALGADDPLQERQWHLAHVGATEAWEVTRGAGIVVAVIDSGVDGAHPDLAGQLVAGRDFVEPGSPPDDPNGHGTLVAGVIAALAGNGTGGAGVAPNTRIMPIRVLDAEGTGRPEDVADGIRWAADNGAHIINMSLTEAPGAVDLGLITSEVEQAIREADERGVLVVGAAGNEGRQDTPYRSSTPVLVAGASDRSDRRWAFSNVDQRTLFAPGVEIVSTWRDGGYAQADGTSFSAPILAAGAALLRAAGLTGSQARQRLIDTAVDIGSGLGRVDLAAAARSVGPASQPPSPAPPSPSPSPAPSPSPSPAASPSPTPAPPPSPDPGGAPTPQPATTTEPATPTPTPTASPGPGSEQRITPLPDDSTPAPPAEEVVLGPVDPSDEPAAAPSEVAAAPAESRNGASAIGWQAMVAATLLALLLVGHGLRLELVRRL